MIAPTVVAALERNHNGDLTLARRMVDVAVACGCAAVKLPVRSIKDYFPDATLKEPNYARPDLGAVAGEVLERLELPAPAVKELRAYCEGRIAFIGAPYDLPSLNQLRDLRVDGYQIDPPVLGNSALVAAIAAERKPTYLAAGMCSDEELSHALALLRGPDLTVLHCVFAQSLPLAETALGLIPYLRERHAIEVGYLGYESGILAALAAFVLGARTIEKTFTVDRHLAGPGHAHSLDREELKSLVDGVRALAAATVRFDARQVLPAEVEAAARERCALVAVRTLAAGTAIEAEMLAVKEAPGGLSPQLLPWLIGKRLAFDVAPDTPITFGVVVP